MVKIVNFMLCILPQIKIITIKKGRLEKDIKAKQTHKKPLLFNLSLLFNLFSPPKANQLHIS